MLASASGQKQAISHSISIRFLRSLVGWNARDVFHRLVIFIYFISDIFVCAFFPSHLRTKTRHISLNLNPFSTVFSGME